MGCKVVTEVLSVLETMTPTLVLAWQADNKRAELHQVSWCIDIGPELAQWCRIDLKCRQNRTYVFVLDAYIELIQLSLQAAIEADYPILFGSCSTGKEYSLDRIHDATVVWM